MFRAVTGHRRLVSLLSRAIARQTLPPSLLFAGPAGVGKRRTAVAVAQALNCQNPHHTDLPGLEPGIVQDACGECASCRRIARGVHPDVIVIEPGESGSIKVEQVRDVIDRAAYRPFEGRRRAVIVDEADAMMAPAQSALLKTLEEPPSASVFILVSSRPDALLPTVLSRCPRLRFGPLTPQEVAAALIATHGYTDAEAHAAAANADGSIGRALSVRSTTIVEARDSAHRLLAQAARAADPVRRLDVARDLAGGKGTPAMERDRLTVCLGSAATLLRDLSLLAAGADERMLANADMRAELEALARSYTADRAGSAYMAVDEALASLERNASPKVVADWLVLRL